MNDTTPQDDGAQMPSSLELLKNKANKLGISFHPNIGEEKLLIKVRKVTDPDKVSTPEEKQDEVQATSTVDQADEQIKPMDFFKLPKETELERNQRLRKEAGKLVRVIVSCMNPNKKSMSGDFFSVSNAVIGTVKKFVQFETPDGYHVPAVLVRNIQERKCQIFVASKDAKGKKIMTGKLINEYNVVILDPLTAGELKDLANRQVLANSID